MNEPLDSIYQKTQALLLSPFYTSDGVQKTPLVKSAFLSRMTEGNVYLKCENLQTTGSFKIRGATSAMLNLSDDDKARGVITASSGNHGAATAAAAQALGISVSIYVPASISATKEKKIRQAGATLIKVDGSADMAETIACNHAREKGQKYISPYNHIDVIAGQGTIAQEILDEHKTIDAVLMSVGGGGLISGMGSYLKKETPNTQVVGCWPENAPAMLACIKAGHVIQVDEQKTLSDGTAGGVETGAITLPLCQQVISDTVLVSEEDIMQAIITIYTAHGFKIEGAAGVAVAGLFKNKAHYRGKNVVIILCGQNIEQSLFDAILNDHPL